MNIHPGQGVRAGRQGSASAAVLLLLLALLAAPVYALSRFSGWIHWSILMGVPLAVSIFTFFAYRSDKQRAESGEWRIPESTLHFAEFIGGWPGAFIAQRRFRHKTSKLSYQVVFWMIILLHQLTAIDSVLGWSITTHAFQFFRSKLTF
jgi:uncharacterized membrane protein YsdA (DUF1294 family)